MTVCFTELLLHLPLP